MATYYVRASGGNDANDGLSFAQGWATIQKAADTATAGDEVRICADGTHTLTATVDFDTNAGTVAGRVLFTGANSAGAIDGTRPTITTASTLANGLFDLGANIDYLRFASLVLDGGGSGKAATTLQANVLNAGNHLILEDCRFTNASGNGVILGAQTQLAKVSNCRFDNNGKGGSGSGVVGRLADRGVAIFLGCFFDNNATHGSGLNAWPLVYTKCSFYRNGADGVNCGSVSENLLLSDCLFYLNGANGLNLDAASYHPTILNCSAVSNGVYGFKFNSMNLSAIGLALNNHTHGNTSGATDINGNVLPGTGNVTGDPLFRNTTAGSEDFTPAYNSPLVNAGYPSGDIGAVQRPEGYPAIADVENGTGYGAWTNELVGTLIPDGPKVGSKTGGR